MITMGALKPKALTQEDLKEALAQELVPMIDK
jgi:hypothetical protein